MRVYSEMQKKAIYTQNKNIIVSASAGSGKTTVLIERLLNLIQNEKVSIKNILAMTFTEAAASEMKKRLSDALNKAIKTSTKEEEILYLQQQQASISDAYISTIHGFCLTIIKNYYYVIGLDKERINSIMDDATTASILEKSMKNTFSKYIEEDSFLQLTQTFSSKANSDETLKETILNLFHLANSKTDPIQFLRSCKIENNYSSMQEYPKEILYYFYDYLKVQCSTIQQACHEYRFLAMDDATCDKEDVILEKIHLLTPVLLSLEKQEYDTFKHEFVLACAKTLPTIKNNEEAKKLKKQIDTLEEDLMSVIFDEKEFLTYSNQNIPLINTLCDVTETFLRFYNDYKEEAKCIDFADMEHYALEILQAENGLIADFYRNLFVEIMVDEFQDSNDVQDSLVKLICRSNNVFRVGDIKQSIYGFRHATPEIMRTLIENKTDNDEIIYLNNNYRSKKSIVDFNNHLFDTLMNIKGFRSSFSEYDHTTCGCEQQSLDCTSVKFHVLDDKYFKKYCKENYTNADALKSNYIATQIKKMVKEGRNYKDFVVLIKTNAKAAFLREAFNEMNIPYFISMKQGFFETNVVLKVIVFLKALLNPEDDLNFCALLLSDFFHLTNDDLIKAKLNKKDSYYDYFNSHLDLSLFNALLDCRKSHKISYILQEIYAFNNFYEQATSIQEKSNLDKLYEIALSYESKQFTTLEQFLTIIEQSSEATVGEAIPIGNEDNVVRVMSIHQSKGLQFPIVFLYSVSNVSIHDASGIVGMDDTLKIALNHVDIDYRYYCKTLERIALNHKITKAALEEEMRLLYVATTRAQEQMHIVDYGNEEGYPPLSLVEIYKGKGFSNWILQAMSQLMHTHVYYNKIYIEKKWEDTFEKQKHHNTYYTFRYKHPSVENAIHSPSENEILSYQPHPFSLKEEYGLERGSSLHKMVEVLPNHSWNKEEIIQTMEKEDLSLSQHDIHVLLSLNENSIFKEAQTGEVYHEFPFMISKDNDIVHGYMDYVSKKENSIIMIDFKSDRNVDENVLIQRYKGQIDAYIEALKCLYPNKKIYAYIYSFELKTMLLM